MTFNSTRITHDYVLADTPDGKPVAIDFKALVGKHILIAARTGSGKSVAARKLLELAMTAGMQVFVFDSDGTLASLRDAASNGILVAGGEHGDPGVSISGVLKHLTRLFTMRASVVLDISTIDVMEQNDIIARFLDAMMKLPPHLHQPCLIMIDEVQNFAPERGRTKAAAAIVRVAKQGRRKGLSLAGATQRLPDVSRGLTSQMAIQLFGRFDEANDRKRVRDELGLSAAEALELRDFLPGQFLINGPAIGGGRRTQAYIRKPLSGELGNDQLVAKLDLPVAPIDEVRAIVTTGAPNGCTVPQATGNVVSPGDVAPADAPDLVECATTSDGDNLATTLLSALAPFGRAGLQRDSLALVVASTQQRAAFQTAISDLLTRRLVSFGSGAKIRITPQGERLAASVGTIRTTAERIALLRAGRNAADERVLACLTAAGNTSLAPAEIRARTGLGPRILKVAIQRLRRDKWLVERKGAVTLSVALARLLSR
ncbi:hypothetical protein GCM10007908_24310 [Rhizobium albus]|nr:hypothetical protein GCM10007908_24310 [Rhizobium albus]